MQVDEPTLKRELAFFAGPGGGALHQHETLAGEGRAAAARGILQHFAGAARDVVRGGVARVLAAGGGPCLHRDVYGAVFLVGAAVWWFASSSSGASEGEKKEKKLKE